MLRSMPEAVRELRHKWKSQVDRVTDLTLELEQDFRFGQRITKTERGYVMGGTLKGGSSSMWYPATREQYHAYRRWRSLEGLQEARNDEAYDRLTRLLARHGVELVTRRGTSHHGRRPQDDDVPHPGYGPLYADAESILRNLPESHLGRDSLRKILLGGWGPDAAKASAYQDGAVMMYEFACRGARRTFLGLFCHELGHAHEVALGKAEKDALYEGYRILIEEDAFFGVEFLVDANTRKLYQKFVFTEFLAETYMVYVACGGSMRSAIDDLPPPAREAWRRIYAVLRRSFDEIEYE